jgi:hypothetical protein
VITDLVHVGAVIAFGGFAGCYWAGLRDWLAGIYWLPCAVFFIVFAASAAGYH